MPASQDMINRLRRMVAEPLETSTYTNSELQAEIERYPYLDSAGLGPSDVGWIAGYDLNAAASVIWTEKASAYAAQFDFRQGDGADYSKSQQYTHALDQAKYYRNRRLPTYLKVQREYSIVNSDGTITREVTS